MQEATALAQAHENLKKGSKNANPVFEILLTPITKGSPIKFLAIRLENKDSFVEVWGWETKEEITIISATEAQEFAKTNNIRVVNKQLPWHRILEIENKAYKTK